MCKDPIYYEAYLAGYRDGVKDVASGKAAAWKSTDIGNSPIRAMAISTRAYNCLANYGCTYVEDVIALSSYSIRTMHNLGPKTAAEIARWLLEHGILSSAWTEYRY